MSTFDMDAITVITYICACLGGILLLLCIVLAVCLLYSHCKPVLSHFQGGYLERNAPHSQRYVIVAADDNDLKEDGNILLKYNGKTYINTKIVFY